ncbi:hypothetical protein AB0M20_20215, partial [Actinoplanes sp. NPDC051633]
MTSDERPAPSGWQHSRSSRRNFLAGAAAVSSGALVGGRASAAHAAESLLSIEQKQERLDDSLESVHKWSMYFKSLLM